MCEEDKNIFDMINYLEIEEEKKLIIKKRFLSLVKKYKNYTKYYIIFFDIGRLIVTLGSISVPALLSTEYYIDRKASYWSVWIISLLVSFINGYITLYKLDKKYYSNIATIERLVCEFWLYMSLCGKYSGQYNNVVANHENQFIYFTHNIEKIQTKNVEDQYIKLFDNNKNNEVKLFSPSPDFSEQLLKLLKDQVEEQARIPKNEEIPFLEVKNTPINQVV